jgi:hypothetical protein
MLAFCAQVLPDGSLASAPSATVDTSSYNFCRFHALLCERAQLGGAAAASADRGEADNSAPLRADEAPGGAAAADAAADAFLSLPSDDEADAQQEASADGVIRNGGGDDATHAPAVSRSLSALVALAGTDPAALELWDLAAGACARLLRARLRVAMRRG